MAVKGLHAGEKPSNHRLQSASRANPTHVTQLEPAQPQQQSTVSILHRLQTQSLKLSWTDFKNQSLKQKQQVLVAFPSTDAEVKVCVYAPLGSIRSYQLNSSRTSNNLNDSCCSNQIEFRFCHLKCFSVAPRANNNVKASGAESLCPTLVRQHFKIVLKLKTERKTCSENVQ